MRAVQVALLVLLPAAIGYAFSRGPELLRWFGDVIDRLRPPPPQPQGPPIERIAADLRRLSALIDGLVVAGPIPGRSLRMRATTTAYDDKLLLACEALGVTPVATLTPMSTEARLRIETALANAGLTW
ncbi:MAG: hypothetical protein DLM59_06380 [Pseudonocardiales bacterium]|nr:MAG: hypothetical protein DLM59_06380 [Pseudonocardiales bacterium]